MPYCHRCIIFITHKMKRNSGRGIMLRVVKTGVLWLRDALLRGSSSWPGQIPCKKKLFSLFGNYHFFMIISNQGLRAKRLIDFPQQGERERERGRGRRGRTPARERKNASSKTFIESSSWKLSRRRCSASAIDEKGETRQRGAELRNVTLSGTERVTLRGAERCAT